MTMPRRALLFAAVLLAASAAAVSGFHLAGDESGLVRGVLTAVRERAEAEAEDAARFAVAYHNRNQVCASILVSPPCGYQFLRCVDSWMYHE
jgi:hypothetical protein